MSWESFIIRLDILMMVWETLRIFHYSPWYTYDTRGKTRPWVENLSLFALIYLAVTAFSHGRCWESFIIRLDILIGLGGCTRSWLRIFHYSPWYTYSPAALVILRVENLSLFALIYLWFILTRRFRSWESFIIRLDILTYKASWTLSRLRIFHYSPWYT